MGLRLLGTGASGSQRSCQVPPWKGQAEHTNPTAQEMVGFTWPRYAKSWATPRVGGWWKPHGPSAEASRCRAIRPEGGG